MLCPVKFCVRALFLRQGSTIYIVVSSIGSGFHWVCRTPFSQVPVENPLHPALSPASELQYTMTPSRVWMWSSSSGVQHANHWATAPWWQVADSAYKSWVACHPSGHPEHARVRSLWHLLIWSCEYTAAYYLAFAEGRRCLQIQEYNGGRGVCWEGDSRHLGNAYTKYCPLSSPKRAEYACAFIASVALLS